jgi:hypothetical protein
VDESQAAPDRPTDRPVASEHSQEPSEQSAEHSPPEAEEKPETPQTRYGSKIGRLKAEAEEGKKAAAAEREAREKAEAEIAELRSQLSRMPRSESVESPGEFSFPSMEEWYRKPGNEAKPPEAFYDERTDARYRWNDQRNAASRAEALSDARYEATVNLTRLQFPDFDSVMTQNVEDTKSGKIPPLQVELKQSIKDSEIGARLAYHLAANPEEFIRLNGLRGRDLAKAVGKLEGRLETVTTGSVSATPKQPPKPAPISPVGRGGASAAESSDDDGDSTPSQWNQAKSIELTADWLRAENRRDQDRRRLR